ncbi:MAG: adenylosuccinate synthetase [Lachnospiraceae bacterium]|nr:adenylosuccinate synthetase [Lachnospiraceae bacterium]
MKEIRENYGINRTEEKIAGFEEKYKELLASDEVLRNASELMKRNAEYITIWDKPEENIRNIENIVFETSQGLLLDADNEKYMPHVTASKTGLYNTACLLKEWNLKLTEVLYVTRSYVTRHGAGMLPCECDKTALGDIVFDRTNVHNEWQGNIRYASHESLEEFINPVINDLNEYNKIMNHKPLVLLLVTHLNETGNHIIFQNEKINIREFSNHPKVKEIFDKILSSFSLYSEDICGTIF